MSCHKNVKLKSVFLHYVLKTFTKSQYLLQLTLQGSMGILDDNVIAIISNTSENQTHQTMLHPDSRRVVPEMEMIAAALNKHTLILWLVLEKNILLPVNLPMMFIVIVLL